MAWCWETIAEWNWNRCAIIKYIFKEAGVIIGPGRGESIFNRRKGPTKNWQLSIWSCRQLWETIGSIGWRGWCWLLATLSESVCSSADGWRLFCTQELMAPSEFSCKTPMADCTCLWIVIGLDVDYWSSKLLTCCCRVSCILWTTPGDSGAEGIGIRLLRDQTALLGRVGVFLKESSCFFTVCATSTFSFVEHAASLRESSAYTFFNCVSWSTSSSSLMLFSWIHRVLLTQLRVPDMSVFDILAPVWALWQCLFFGETI